MANGGFRVSFDGKEADHCYAVAFDYDEWQYMVDGVEKKDLPAGTKTITITVEVD